MKKFWTGFLMTICLTAFAQLTPLHIESRHTEFYEYVDGYHMSIVPPEDFTATDCYTGFQWPEMAASISFAKIPADFATSKATMEPNLLKSRGLGVRLQREVLMNGIEGFVTKCTQMEKGGQYVKYILLINTGTDETTLVNAVFPLAEQEKLDVLLRNTILGIIYHG